MSETACCLQQINSYKPDPDLENKVKKTCERISENLHISANEPSLAFYRLAEHVRKALPPTVESRTQVRRLQQQLQGAYFDAENGLGVVQSMERAAPHLANVQELLKNAIFLQQQIKYEQTRRPRREPSMYQRFSAHLTSVDLPDLSDLREQARETASRVESAIRSDPLQRQGSTGARPKSDQFEQNVATGMSRSQSVQAATKLLPK